MTRLASLLRDQDPILQALRIGPHTFPGIWHYMLPQEFLGLKFPAESRATCMNCPKACYDSYRADYRCCTYHPRVPNFLLGLALQTEQGRGSVKGLLDRGMLLPEGMHYAPGQWIDYLDDLQAESFGRSEKVLCPHLDQSNGYCRIHAFRNSVCSTFFCYKDHGDLGDHFWSQVQTLGSQVEAALQQWSLFVVGFDLSRYFKAFDRLAPEILKVTDKTGWQEFALDELWGNWRGRELELMEACAEAVLEQRENLWEIANSFPIDESKPFDKALIRSVPRRLKDQVDPEDQAGDDGEAARPRDLWLSCLKSYHKLWDLPEGAFELSPRIDILPNEGSDAESVYYKDKPYVLHYYLRKSSKTIDWKLYLSEAQKRFLEMFREEARELDWEVLMSREFRGVPQGKEFLAQLVTQKILVRRQYH